MNSTAASTDLACRLATLDFRSRPGRALAVATADSALDGGELALAAAICRRVLAGDLENADAYAVLQCVLVREQQFAEATVIANRTLAHYRSKDARHTTANALHVLHGRGFRARGILDIGAYEGEFAILARQFFPAASLLMVEPQTQKHAVLTAVAAALGGDVGVASVLLGDTERENCAFHQLRTPFGSTGSSIYQEASDYPRDTLQLPMRTVDRLLADYPHRCFDLCKIDVQGAELDVLLGMKETLGSVQALVVELSLHVVNHGAPLLAQVTAEFDRLGFAMFDMVPLPRDGDGLQRQVDAVFVAKDSPLWHAPTSRV
jgi:FkbM family methyltransferase